MREVGNALDEVLKREFTSSSRDVNLQCDNGPSDAVYGRFNASSEYIWFFGKSAGEKDSYELGNSPSYGSRYLFHRGLLH